MRVLIVTGLFPPDIGGPATYSKILAEELPKHGVAVEVLSFGSVRQMLKFIRHLVYFFKVLRLGRKADVIFAQDPISVGLPSMLAAKILHKKFILKIVGDYAWEQGVQRFGVKELLDIFLLKKNYPWQVRLLRWFEKLVAEKADKIITPSEYLKSVIVKWGIDAKKIFVVYNAVDFKPVDPIKHNDERWIVSVGRLVPWKGFDTLIEIMPDLLKETSGFKLKVVGGGPELKSLKLKVESKKLESAVELLGDLPHEKTLAYIASADVFILNSGYEGFSHVLVEAHNQGVPVLASRAGGNDEMVAGDALFEYNNKDEIKEKVLRYSLMGRGESKPHRFLGNMVDDTMKILEQVCES